MTFEIDYPPSASERDRAMAAERVRKVAVELEAAEAEVRHIMDRNEGLVAQVRDALAVGVPVKTLSLLTGINESRIVMWK